MTETIAKATLHHKIAEVMSAVENIPKRGTNKHFGYKFATEADVSDAIRSELSKRSVATYVSSSITTVREGKTSSGKDTLFTDVSINLTFACGDTGETWTVAGCGTGDDPSDKGVYKAITGAVKYALLKTFLVPTGDDPEVAQDHQEPVAEEYVWPFAGDSKGLPFSKVPDKDLQYMAGRAVKDDQYKAKNLLMQKAANDILEQREAERNTPVVAPKEDAPVVAETVAETGIDDSVKVAAIAIAEAVGKSKEATAAWIDTRDDKEAALTRVVEQAATSGLDVRSQVVKALEANGLERFVEMFDAVEIK